MSKVNGVIAALNLYPELSSTNTQQSYSPSTNPTDLIVDFFKATKGYDWLIDTVSRFISYELPALELAVKGVLLSNIRIMLSCSVSPIITRNMINDGIVIDLNRTDLLNIFKYSPLDKKPTNPGKYFYFGCDPEDGITIVEDLKKSRDFNAVLWYSKNTPGERIVWRRESDIDKEIILSKINEEKWAKQVKSNGIATIEFNGRSSGLRKADGSSHMIQEPIDNCLHLFIGCCAPKETGSKKTEITNCTRVLSSFNTFSDKIDATIQRIETTKKTSKQEAVDNGATPEELNKIDSDCNNDLSIMNRLKDALNGIENGIQTNKTVYEIMGQSYFELNSIHETIQIPSELVNTNTETVKAEKKQYMADDSTAVYDYPLPESNYYYLHPLFEWNTDFIMSLKLFDEKVVAAQLIEALTNCLSFSAELNISAQTKFIQLQIRDLVTKVIESDDGTVSDCFFSFSNDSYNAMLNEVELNRASLHSVNGTTVNDIPSVEDVMSSLNTLSHDATKEELNSAISGSLFSAANNTGPAIVGKQLDFDADLSVNFNIIDNLLTQLAYVITSVVLQPKVYTLLMANLTVLGNEPNFELSKFIQQFGDLMSALIKEIRDNLLEYFKEELLKVLGNLVKELATKLTLEQYQYYITLLTHCINCLNSHRGEFDWVQDNVDYADITELNQEENQEC